MSAVGTGTNKSSSQHLGFGKRLLAKADEIAYNAGYRKIAVISGVGVKDYYRKLGYVDGKYYMIKELKQKSIEYNYQLYALIYLFILFMIFVLNHIYTKFL